jgi:SAM-dependent methyltransferase
VDVKESVQRQFGQVAANYASSAVHRAGVDLEQLIARAALAGSERVLDAGTGTGHTALALAPQAAEVVAVDLTEPMLAQGRRLAEERGLANVRFERADVERLPFPDASFDLVVSRYSAHHWPHPAAGIAELARVLRPGGRALLADIVGFEDPACDTHLQAVELLRDTSHVRDHRVDEWLAIFGGCGLVASCVFRWELRLEFASWVERMQTPPEFVTAIRRLLDGAPEAVRAALRVEPDHSLSIPGALIEASKA